MADDWAVLGIKYKGKKCRTPQIWFHIGKANNYQNSGDWKEVIQIMILWIKQ